MKKLQVRKTGPVRMTSAMVPVLWRRPVQRLILSTPVGGSRFIQPGAA